MKVQIQWIEDNNHMIAGDCLLGIEELISLGIFNTIEASVYKDTLTIEGEDDEVKKLIEKIQQDYADYGQITIKTDGSLNEATKIKSFTKQEQKEFDRLVNAFSSYKSNLKKKRSNNYITKLNEYMILFKEFKDIVYGSERLIIQKYMDEIQELLNTDFDDYNSIKPVNEDAKLLSDTKNSIAYICKLYLTNSLFDKIVEVIGFNKAKEKLIDEIKKCIGYGTSKKAAIKFIDRVNIFKSVKAVDELMSMYMLKGDGLGLNEANFEDKEIDGKYSYEVHIYYIDKKGKEKDTFYEIEGYFDDDKAIERAEEKFFDEYPNAEIDSSVIENKEYMGE